MDEVSLFSGMPSPELVSSLEQKILEVPQVDLNTTNLIHGGMCARTIVIPAGVVLTGALLNADNICIMSGDITVTTDSGPLRLTGVHVIPASAGFKRAGYAHSETHWTTVFPTELTDIEQIEDEMTGESSMLQTRRKGIEFEKHELLTKEVE